MKNLGSKTNHGVDPINPETNKEKISYGFYSKVLKQPFDTLDELNKAEQVHYDAIAAKENKAAEKKADAKKVEDAFVALNRARKDYKDNLLKLTNAYRQDLTKLKENFESDKNRVHNALADAETKYEAELKAFTEKYEQFHLTLKDGDFETTISGSRTAPVKEPTERLKDKADLFSLFDLFFNF